MLEQKLHILRSLHGSFNLALPTTVVLSEAECTNSKRAPNFQKPNYCANKSRTAAITVITTINPIIHQPKFDMRFGVVISNSSCAITDTVKKVSQKPAWTTFCRCSGCVTGVLGKIQSDPRISTSPSGCPPSRADA